MLSAAKHLLFLVENKQKQILRCAQNDTGRAIFSSMLDGTVRWLRSSPQAKPDTEIIAIYAIVKFNEYRD